MPYRLLSFDGINLPEAMPEDDLGVGPVASTLVDSLAGVFDYYGSTRRYPKRQVINYTGIIVGQGNTHLVDEVGDDIVDEAGDFIVLGADYAADLRDQTDSLKSRIGVYGQLIRRREEDNMDQFKYARLLDVRHTRTLRDVDRIARLALTFEATGRPWRKSTATTTEDTLSTGANAVDVTVDGVEPVTDAIVTITATSNITSVTVAAGGDQKWSFTGTISAGDDLVIDTGAATVLNDGVDAYDDFALDATHTADAWLHLPSGTTTLTVTITGGPGTISIEHRDQWM